MHKSIFTALMLAAFWLRAGDPYVYPEWIRLMTDRGDADCRWAMLSSPRRQAVKRFQLDFPPAELAGAALEYHIQTSPYDPLLKQHITAAEHPWGYLLATVNGTVILDQPAAPHIRKGEHFLPFPAALLRQGENVVTLAWKEIPAELAGQQRYGYLYLSHDATPRSEGDHPEHFHIRLQLRFAGIGGGAMP